MSTTKTEWIVYCTDGREAQLLQGPRTAAQVKKLGYGFTAVLTESWKFTSEAQALNKARIVNKHMGWAGQGLNEMAVKPAWEALSHE